MPVLVQHRVNARAALTAVAPRHGAEIDLRSHAHGAPALHLAHDPWAAGEPLEPWLDAYVARGAAAGPLVVNTKEDGLEARFMALAAARGLTHYFFLDTALPTLWRLAHAGHGAHLCLRISAVEPLAGLEPLLALPAGSAPRWIWADCFAGVPLPAATLAAARARARICLVSPELQRAPAALPAFLPLAAQVDAVCTKDPAAWAAACHGVDARPGHGADARPSHGVDARPGHGAAAGSRRGPSAGTRRRERC